MSTCGGYDTIPLLWFLLFSAKDIRTARFIDEHDHDNPNTQSQREENFEMFGHGSYPYFVVAKQEALANLDARLPALVEILGDSVTPSAHTLRSFIADRMSEEYVLMQTSFLPGIEDRIEDLRHWVTRSEFLAISSDRHGEFWEERRAQLHSASNPDRFLWGATDPADLKHFDTTVKAPSAVPNGASKDWGFVVNIVFGLALVPIFVGVFTGKAWISLLGLAALGATFAWQKRGIDKMLRDIRSVSRSDEDHGPS